jgi:cytochrome c peroxidase
VRPAFSSSPRSDTRSSDTQGAVRPAERNPRSRPIKTFTLRGIRESPPYLHHGRLLTLEDTIEFFNMVLGTQLTGAEKSDLLAFLYVL